MDLIKAHSHSANHRKNIEKSSICGCFYCEKTFSSDIVRDWIDNGQTALCPFCSIDSVVGDFNVSINSDFLKQMKEFWFNEKNKSNS